MCHTQVFNAWYYEKAIIGRYKWQVDGKTSRIWYKRKALKEVVSSYKVRQNDLSGLKLKKAQIDLSQFYVNIRTKKYL